MQSRLTDTNRQCILHAHDCCIKVNIEQINVGNREAMAFGPASAANYIKIVTNQQ